jgi:Mn2+/Fe2+ NRAMP family transporter
LPITLVFVWRLSASAELMGRYRNGRVFNVIAGAPVLATSGLSVTLLVVTLTGA